MTAAAPSSVPTIIAVNLGVVTAYAVRGSKTVLVDSGPVGGAQRLLRRLHNAGIEAESISLIVLTHCHPDHAGGAAALSRRLNVPIAVHQREHGWARDGASDFYQPTGLMGRVLVRTMKTTFEPFDPDIVLHDGADLSEHGAPLRVRHTPGHTPGSISLIDQRDGDALVGDLLAGHMLRRDRPRWPFLAQDRSQIVTSTQQLLQEGPQRLLFGHGRPASAASVRDHFLPAARRRIATRP